MKINSNEKLYTQKDLSLGSGISTLFLYHAKLQRCVARGLLIYLVCMNDSVQVCVANSNALIVPLNYGQPHILLHFL